MTPDADGRRLLLPVPAVRHLTRRRAASYAAAVIVPAAAPPTPWWRMVAAGPWLAARRGARALLRTAHGGRRLLAFGLITAGVLLRRPGTARPVLRRQLLEQVRRGGLGLLPLAFACGAALGVAVLGQAAAVLVQLGAADLAGTLAVTLVVRELAPFLTAVIVLLRVGTPTVVELANARAAGEVEALEALGIDPVHFLVVPRVLGFAAAAFALNVYTLLVALLAGWGFLFVTDSALAGTALLGQVAAALDGYDFVLLGLKSAGFGALIAVASCYHGLAFPLTAAEVPAATARAVEQALLALLLADAALLGLRLLL